MREEGVKSGPKKEEAILNKYSNIHKHTHAPT
jgi:hypothetical protein